MIHPPSVRERLARWSLLLAAVLHFGIAATAPAWHLSPSAPGVADVLEQPREDAPGSPLDTHGDQACLVCQSLGSAAALAAPAALLPGTAHRAPSAPGRSVSPPASPAAPSRARAPPHA